jgi:hypothetical protein
MSERMTGRDRKAEHEANKLAKRKDHAEDARNEKRDDGTMPRPGAFGPRPRPE